MTKETFIKCWFYLFGIAAAFAIALLLCSGCATKNTYPIRITPAPLVSTPPQTQGEESFPTNLVVGQNATR